MAKLPKGFVNAEEAGYDGLWDGAPVIIDKRYAGDESPRKYFVCELSKGFCLLADDKKMLKEQRGYIYHTSVIECYKKLVM